MTDASRRVSLSLVQYPATDPTPDGLVWLWDLNDGVLGQAPTASGTGTPVTVTCAAGDRIRVVVHAYGYPGQAMTFGEALITPSTDPYDEVVVTTDAVGYTFGAAITGARLLKTIDGTAEQRRTDTPAAQPPDAYEPDAADPWAEQERAAAIGALLSPDTAAAAAAIACPRNYAVAADGLVPTGPLSTDPEPLVPGWDTPVPTPGWPFDASPVAR